MSKGAPTSASDSTKLLHQQIVMQLRRDIGDGVYPPGAHLPSEREIAMRFGVAQMTVRQALSVLEDRGMIRRRHGRKTEVLAAREKLTLAVLFGPSLTDETAYFYRALLSAIREQASERGYELKVFDALQLRSAELHPQRGPMVAQLESELRSHTLDAVFQIAISEGDLSDVMAFSLPGMTITTARSTDVTPDIYRFGYEAMRDHVAHGRRRVCFIRTRFADEWGALGHEQDLLGARQAARELKVEEPLAMDLTVEVTMGTSSGRLHRAMVQLFERWKAQPQEMRPDALIVSDDIMMRTVSMALTEAGLKTPDDLRVVCATNDRADFYYIAKVHRFAFPVGEVIERSFDLLELRLRGEAEPELPILVSGAFMPEPVFENEDDLIILESIYENKP